MKKIALIILLLLVAGYFFLPDYGVKLKYQLKYGDQIKQRANQYQISPALLASVVYNESRFNSEAVSSQNAYGLAQIQLPTGKHVLGREISPEDLKNPSLNLKIGAKYLSQLIGRYQGDKMKALIGYNFGPTKLDKDLEEGIPLENLEDSYIFARKVVEVEKIYGDVYSQELGVENSQKLTKFNLWSSLLY